MLFREFIADEFVQSELAMVQFSQRQLLLVFLLCFSLFLFIVSLLFFQLNNNG